MLCMANRKTNEKPPIEPKLLDIDAIKNSGSLKNITTDMLLADAMARQNKEAFDFVCEKDHETIERKTKKGTVQITRPVSTYRLEYLTKYAGYEVPKETTEEKNARKKAEAIKARDEKYNYINKYFESLEYI